MNFPVPAVSLFCTAHSICFAYHEFSFTSRKCDEFVSVSAASDMLASTVTNMARVMLPFGLNLLLPIPENRPCSVTVSMAFAYQAFGFTSEYACDSIGTVSKTRARRNAVIFFMIMTSFLDIIISCGVFMCHWKCLLY